MAFELISTVLVAAANHDLTDLATARLELEIEATDNGPDDYLTMAVTQISARINSYCNRVFQVETVRDLFLPKSDPYPQRRNPASTILQLSRWPVVSITSVVQGPIGGIQTTLSEGVDFKVNVTAGQLERLGTGGSVAVPWGNGPYTVESTCGYTKPVPREAKTIPASGPFTLAVAKASAFATDDGVIKTSTGAAFAVVDSNPAQGEYSVENGVYTFNALDAGTAIGIAYTYAAVPDDVVDAALRLVTGRFKGRGRDPLLRSHGESSLAVSTYWIGTPGLSGSMPEEIAGILDNYRVPVLG